MSGSDPSKRPVDSLGRQLADLRISVTDRCNFRCRYCMPREQFTGASFLGRSELLTFEEIARVAERFVGLGVGKLRITGGEPLVRRQLPVLIRPLADLGVDLALTTNGVLLDRQAAPLRAAGLGRLTVSLDALDEETFQQISDAPGWKPRDVLLGIEAAIQAGFPPPKINCVVRRGVNDDQILPLARHFFGKGHVLRFIEYMDVGEQNGWTSKEVTVGSEVLDRLTALGRVEALPSRSDSDVAQRYLVGGRLEVGVISSISKPFCGSCTRLRLSADGGLYTCLFSGVRHDLKDLLRRGATDEEIDERIRCVWAARTDRYSEERLDPGENVGSRTRLPTVPRVPMSFIGG